MQRLYHPPNLTIMDATQRKELLHLRIEQANEEMQIVLAKMVEALFQAYQPEVIEDPIVGYEADGTVVRASVAKAQFAEDLSKPEEFIPIEDFEREMETSEAA